MPVTLLKEADEGAAALANDIEKWLTDASRVMEQRNIYLTSDVIITPATDESGAASAMIDVS